MADQEASPEVHIEGKLVRIVSYRINHSSTTGPGSITPVMDTRTTTRLEIYQPEKRARATVDFGAYVGIELLHEDVVYRTQTKETSGESLNARGPVTGPRSSIDPPAPRRTARQRIITQELIPSCNELPSYLVTSTEYIG